MFWGIVFYSRIHESLLLASSPFADDYLSFIGVAVFVQQLILMWSGWGNLLFPRHYILSHFSIPSLPFPCTRHVVRAFMLGLVVSRSSATSTLINFYPN